MANDSKMQEEKRLFEGECCALSYNDDEEWFDDEDDEFEFDPKGSNKWFEDAFEQGLKELEEIQRIPEMKKDEEKGDVENKDEEIKDEESEENTIVINIIF